MPPSSPEEMPRSKYVVMRWHRAAKIVGNHDTGLFDKNRLNPKKTAKLISDINPPLEQSRKFGMAGIIEGNLT
jgi:hypothetical protein